MNIYIYIFLLLNIFVCESHEPLIVLMTLSDRLLKLTAQALV